VRVVFDARAIAIEFSGLARYTGCLLDTLLRTRTNLEVQILVLLDAGADYLTNQYYDMLLESERKGLCSIIYVSAPSISLRQHFKVARLVNKIRPDIYFYPHFDLPIGVKADSVFVVHDLIPLVVSGYVQRFSWVKKLYFRLLINLSLILAQRCIAVSETTKKDLLSFFGHRYLSKIETVYEASFLEDVPLLEVNPTGIPNHGKYLLYVGDRRPHKNLKRVLDVFIHLRDSHNYPGILVIVGSKKNYRFSVEEYVNARTDVKILGSVSDESLLELYKYTDSLLFLSDYEGFGLPVLEAARFHRRMILSDGGSLAEIAPPGACVISSKAPIDVACAKIHEYLDSNKPVDYTGFNERFSWLIAAKKIFPFAYLDT